MKPRRHRNNRARLTARERAKALAEWWVTFACIKPATVLENAVTVLLGQHARATLARDRARRRRAGR